MKFYIDYTGKDKLTTKLRFDIKINKITVFNNVYESNPSACVYSSPRDIQLTMANLNGLKNKKKQVIFKPEESITFFKENNYRKEILMAG